MKRRAIIMVLLLFCSFLFQMGAITQPTYAKISTPVVADKDDDLPNSNKGGSEDSEDSDPTQPADPSDSSDSSWVPEWVQKLIEKIDQLFQTFQDLMSGKLIYDAIQGLIVMLVDDMLAPLYSVFAKSYLFTPRLAEIGVVFKGWSFITIMSFAALLIGSIILGYNISKGKKDLKLLLRSFLISMVAAILSLTILNMINVGINWVTQISLEGIIGTTNIKYQGLTGQQIMKSVILGADGITSPEYEAQTVGQIVVASEGGLFSLIFYVFNIAFPLWVLSVMKSLTVMLMVIFVGSWITYAAYSGQIETLYSFVNLYARTLMVGYFSAIHWAVFVRLQTDYGTGDGFSAEIGMAPLFLACFTVLLLFIFFYFFWFKPLVKAVQQPINLNGGELVENAGKRGQVLSKSLNAIGKRLGSDSLQRKSLNWEDKAKRMTEVGERMKSQKAVMVSRAASALTGTISEEVQGVRYKEPDKWVESGQTVTSNVSHTPKSEVYTEASAATMYKTLKSDGFHGAAVVRVDAKDRAVMPKVVEQINQKHAGSISWNAAKSELLVKNSSNVVNDALQKAGITPVQTEHGYTKDDVFVNAKSKEISNFNDKKPESKEAFDQASKALGGYQTIPMSADRAKETHRNLQHHKSNKNMEWVSSVSVGGNGLIIPAHALKQSDPVVQSILSQTSDKRLVTLPKNSAFLKDMLEDWKASPSLQDLVQSVEPQGNGYSALVPTELVKKFEMELENYRRNRTLYWRTKNGSIKTIKDGVPVNSGSVPPLGGINMGSFEKLQEEAMYQNQNKANTTAKKNSAAKSLGGKEDKG